MLNNKKETVELIGGLSIRPSLSSDLTEYLQRFCATRRIKRASDRVPFLNGNKGLDYCYNHKTGEDGEFYAYYDFHYEKDDSVINEDVPPVNQPSIFCNFSFNDEGDKIIWSGDDNTEEPILWLRYLINNFLKPNGYIVNGSFDCYHINGQDFTIEVEDNEVYAWHNECLLKPLYIMTTYKETTKGGGMSEVSSKTQSEALDNFYLHKKNIINDLIYKELIDPKFIMEIHDTNLDVEFGKKVFITAPGFEYTILLERVFR